MTAPAHVVRYTWQEYLALEAVSNVKHEYLDGQISSPARADAGFARALLAGEAEAALTAPAVDTFTDALLLGVTRMSAAAGITGGTLYAEAARPAGRTNPPV